LPEWVKLIVADARGEDHGLELVAERNSRRLVDASTGTVYVSDFSWADVSVINGGKCDATRASGCHAVREIPVGSRPISLVTSADSSSLYVALTFPPQPLAIVKIKG